ncbi:AAA family ATPase [Streptomyces sp. NPDC059209]|uniref:AAA family ATPase n=1 Tax=Streptomyces sp. NPDC059209 TaxID=3346769 RepID=UPI00368C8BCC
MVRALVVGVGDFPEPDLDEMDLAEGRTAFAPLSSIGPAVRALGPALDRNGVLTGGDPLLEIDRSEFTERWRLLRRGGAAPDEPLIVHFAGHGIVTGGNLYLATAGAETEDVDDSCVNFGPVLDSAENSRRPVLFLLDVCGAGQAVTTQQLRDIAARRAQGEHRNAWIIAACSADEITNAARFTAATTAVLHQLAAGELDLSPTLPHMPVNTFAGIIDREMARTGRRTSEDGGVVCTPREKATIGEVPPFLSNPAHTDDPQAALLDSVNPQLREFANTCSPGLDPLHFATRAAGRRNPDTVHFAGRKSALERIENWVNDSSPDPERLLVVTGAPGTGKSALLGVTACLTHPELRRFGNPVRAVVRSYRPQPVGRVLAVHARQLTLQQITDSLQDQLRLSAGQIGGRSVPPGGGPQDAAAHDSPVDTAALVEEIRATGSTFLILDALDEADDPRAVLNHLILPLIDGVARDPAAFRVLLGTRPWWDALPSLHAYTRGRPASLLDLEPRTTAQRLALAADLYAYLESVLGFDFHETVVRRIAERIAQYTDGGAFLVAALYSDHLLSSPEREPDGPPCSITGVFDLHVDALARRDAWVRPVLDVLGQAYGDGLPLSLIHAAALAHHPRSADRPTPQLADTRRALATAAFYLRTTVDTDHRLLYRYYHQALTDHTVGRVDPTILHTALVDTLPRTASADPDWEQAAPYLTRHAPDHARAAGPAALDTLLEDVRFLVHADPEHLPPHLRHARSVRATHCARVYRTSTSHHPLRHRPEARRDLLALDAAVWRNEYLAREFANVLVNGRPAAALPVWATGTTADPARLQTLTHGFAVWATATAVLPDKTVVGLSAGSSDAIVVWDLTTGRHVRTLEHEKVVRAVTVLPGERPLVVSAGNDQRVIVWDLTTGKCLRTLTGHERPVRAVTVLPGERPLVVSAGNDRRVIVWDLTTGECLRTLTDLAAVPRALASLTLSGGRAAVLLTARGEPVRVWDPLTGEDILVLEVTASARALAAVTLSDGTPVGLAAVGADVVMWDLDTGSVIRTLRGHARRVRVRALGTVVLPDGGVAVVTAGNDRRTVVRDLNTASEVGAFTGHSALVNSVSAATLSDGQTVVVGGGLDKTVTTWTTTLVNDAPEPFLRGHQGQVRALATAVPSNGASLVVTGGNDNTVKVRDVPNGTTIASFAHNPRVWSLATLVRGNGSGLLVVGGNNGRVAVHDLETLRQVTTLDFGNRIVTALAVASLPGGPDVAVAWNSDRSTALWDLTAHRLIRELPAPTSAVVAATSAVLPDGQHVTLVACNRRVIVADLLTGRPLRTLSHSTMVHALAVTELPGRPVVAVVGDDAGQITVWDLLDGSRVRVITGHGAPVRAVAAATGEGRTVVIAGDAKRRLTVSDAGTGKPLRPLFHLPGRIAALAPAGDGVAVAYGQDVGYVQWT